MSLVSIIVPVYKTKEGYLRNAIDSLIKQTYSNIEVILIDDGSPDNGGQICDEYSNIDSRIHVIHQSNQGVSSARNKGMKAAKGEWITFVDSDDWIESDSIEILMDRVKKDSNMNIDIVLFSMLINRGDTELKNPFWVSGQKEFLDKYEVNQLQIQILHKAYSSFKPVHAMVGVVACKMYNSFFLKANNLQFNETLNLAEDGIFAFRALELANQVVYCDHYLYHYRIHSDSATNMYRKDAVNDYTKALNELEKWVVEFKKDDTVFKAFYYRAIISFYSILNQNIIIDVNQNSKRKKIEMIKEVVNSHPYNLAIVKIPTCDVIINSSYFRGLGLFLLKVQKVSLFYYYNLLRKNVMDAKKKYTQKF